MNENSISLRPMQLGLSLGTFLLVVYLACVAFAIVAPDRGLHQVWLQFLPGFAWNPQGILIGVVESSIYGLVTGLVFAPIANLFGIASRG